jgi:hypothetical protein
MSKTKYELKKLFFFGENVEEVKKFLEDNPSFNVNEGLDGYDTKALHCACENGHHEIVSVLLAHPHINVNQKRNDGWTPFLIGCGNGKVEVVKILLKDSRVNIDMADDRGCTPLWYASYYERVEVIKWIIASGREINLDKKGEWFGKEYTAIEIARGGNKTEVVSLLERFTKNQAQTRQEIRKELNITGNFLSGLF